MTRIFLSIVALILIVVGAVYAVTHKGTNAPVLGAPSATVAYLCNGGNTLNAAYYEGESKPAASPDQPPVPGGSLMLTLDNGTQLKLAQTISADGARYANPDESFVFWSKGNGALVLENNQEKTYVGCISLAPEAQGLAQAYATSSQGFSIRYPKGYAVDESYRYQMLGPGKDIAGVKFTIAPEVATGTNLSSDTYLSVETRPRTTECSAALFLDGAKASTFTEGETTYSVASTTGAGAGNRYEETVYAFPGTNPCMAVRYFVHYGAIGNYPEGVVKEFTMASTKFDDIRRSLVISQ